MARPRLLLLGDSNFTYSSSPSGFAQWLGRSLSCCVPSRQGDTSVATLLSELLPGQVVSVPCRTLRLSRDVRRMLLSFFCVLQDRPLIVLMALGQNDVHDHTSSTRSDSDLPELRKKIEFRLDEVMKLCHAHPHVLPCFLVPFNDDPVHFTKQYLEGSAILEEVIRNTDAFVAVDVNGPFVDDHYHLDEPGRRQLAEDICKWFSLLDVKDAFAAKDKRNVSKFAQCVWCSGS